MGPLISRLGLVSAVFLHLVSKIGDPIHNSGC